jgi:hypothetical protein
MIRCLLTNALWMASSAPAAWRFHRAWRDPRRHQQRLLAEFLRRNAETAYGRKHRYGKLLTVEQFQESVPIVSYDHLEPWIERIRRGEPNVLTAEPVVAVEKTSGSAGAAKYIPYTRTLLREFGRAIGAWMYDLFRHEPSLLGGRHYWAISPLARRPEVTPGGVPVGLDDAAYLGRLSRWVSRAVMAVPGDVGRAADIEACRRATLAHLARCPDLRLISVWNPSFLTILVDRLPPGTRPSELWPKLRLISCWTSAGATRFVGELKERFPGVTIQGKGLLATEGVVSVPLVGRPAPAPAITSHFLEFVGDDGRARLVDELEVGRRYRVLMTTGGGLARYSLGDLVEVVAPRAIEFVGKADNVSDLCGEKLSEGFVGRVLDEVAARRGLASFLMLAPEWSRPPRYLLFAETPDAPAIADEVETALRASVHYDYCRRLEQLGPLQGVAVRHATEGYLRGCEALGQRASTVKPACLRRELGWRERLEATDAG